MKIVTIEHRGVKMTYALDDIALFDSRFDIEKYAEDRARKEVNYMLDEKPARVKFIKQFEHLKNKREEAKQKALDNLKYSVQPSFLAILEQFHLLDIMIEKESFYNHPLSMVVPQLNALADDMTHHRSSMDRAILFSYWDADEELESFMKKDDINNTAKVV